MKKIILAAIACYVVILAAGGTAYFVLSEQKAELPREETTQGESVSREAQAAKERAEAAKAREEAAKQEIAAREAKEKERAALTQLVTVEKKNGLTLYTGDYPKKPAPGVYLRPFIVSDGVSSALKFDVYYYYDINDPAQTAWIHGDALTVTVDGETYHLMFSAHDRRDKMSTDAESLAENYVHDATEQEIALLRAIGKASSVRITYYRQASGDARSQTLTSEDIQKIRAMVALYDLDDEEEAF